jgi:hypothetical protein
MAGIVSGERMISIIILISPAALGENIPTQAAWISEIFPTDIGPQSTKLNEWKYKYARPLK